MFGFSSILYCLHYLMCHGSNLIIQQQYVELAILLYTSVRVSTNNWSVDLYNGDLQTTTVSSTCNFTQGWLNSYCLMSALSCPVIVLHKQSNERSWSRMFVFSLSRELYCNFIIFCVHIVVCAFTYLSIMLDVVYLERVRCIC